MEKSVYLNARVFAQLISARLADERSEEEKEMSRLVYNLVKL